MYLRNGKCAACNHQDIEACRRLLNMKKSIRVSQGMARSNSSFLSISEPSNFFHNSVVAQLQF